MITFLSGGTGTLKLISGVRQILHDHEIAVIASTAEDMWISGNHAAPDIDTAIFLFAGILNTNTWSGIRGDTFSTYRYLAKTGGAEPVPVGDKARAVQIARAAMLRRGATKTEAVLAQSEAFGITAAVLPATDADMTTCVDTGRGRVHLHEYIASGAEDAEVRVVRVGEVRPDVGMRVLEAIESSDAVIIGPDNPARGILPILECRGVREALRSTFVAAVTPFREGRPVDPHDAALMRTAGQEPTSAGTYALYRDIADVFVQDIRDAVEVPGALRLGTRMRSERDYESLAWDLMTVVRHAVL